MRALWLVGLLGCGPGPGGAAGGPAPGPDSGGASCGAGPAPAPNVVVVLWDDVGWTGPSGGRTSRGYGSDYHQTPRLDALAEEGIAFSAAYVSPQCQPSRAALLTGQHAARTGMYANFDGNRADPALRALDAPPTLERLPLEARTLAEYLGPAGWRTASFGKWHIGVHGVDGPVEQGFDLNLGGTEQGAIHGGADGHFARADGSFDLPGLRTGGVPGQFAADRITDEAIAWLAEDPAQPALAFVSHWSVHTPIQAPAADRARFEGLPPGTHHDDPVYAGMLYNLDANLGRLVDFLAQTPDPRRPCEAMLDHTLLVVLSDNGAAGGYAAEGVDVSREISNQLPLRSGKGTVWEGGVRVPMVIRWARGGAGGRVVDQPVQHVDLVPTVLDLVGLEPDPAQPLDGRSLRPLLEGTGPLARDAIFLHFPAYLDYVDTEVQDRLRQTPASVAWDGRYKLIWRYETATWELYDLETDLGEQTDLAAAEPGRVAELGQRLVDWLVQTGAALPRYKGSTVEVPLPDPGGGSR